MGLCALLVLATGCGSPPGDRLVGASDEELPAMSLYCPEWASVEQCIQYERVMEHLRRSPHTKCNIAAERLDYQDANPNYHDVGVYVLPPDPEHPNRTGGSHYVEAGGYFHNYTVVYPLAFQSDHELALTLVHEAYGHQYLNNPDDEDLAEAQALACGTEN